MVTARVVWSMATWAVFWSLLAIQDRVPGLLREATVTPFWL
jgi:hypothetical protein